MIWKVSSRRGSGVEFFIQDLFFGHFADGICNRRFPVDRFDIASAFKNNMTGIKATHHLAVTIDGFRRKTEAGNRRLPLIFRNGSVCALRPSSIGDFIGAQNDTHRKFFLKQTVSNCRTGLSASAENNIHNFSPKISNRLYHIEDTER